MQTLRTQKDIDLYEHISNPILNSKFSEFKTSFGRIRIPEIWGSVAFNLLWNIHDFFF